jgi:Sec-independent protein translocase protein TatA
VEQFNQVLPKHVLTAKASNKDWHATLPTMLRNYRSTPHQITKETPAKLLMNRELRTKIPSITDKKQVDDDKLRKTDRKTKEKYKQHADMRGKAKKKTLKQGDFVLLQQNHKNKYSTNFRLDLLKVVQVKGSQIIMKDNSGMTYHRNSSHVKKFLKQDEEEVEASVNEEELEGEVEDAEPPSTQTLPESPPQPSVSPHPIAPQHQQGTKIPVVSPSTSTLRR